MLSGAELSSSVVQFVVVCMNNYMCRYILAVYIVVCVMYSVADLEKLEGRF